MSGHGSPTLDLAGAQDLRVVIVAGLWHEQVMEGLLAGARRALAEAGVGDVREVRVPGAFELPIAASAATRLADAVVALGVVIRGGTPHFDYVCNAATDGLARVALDSGVPVGFGLLTCDNEAQALDRAGLAGSAEDKGFDVAAAAIATVRALSALR